MTWGTPLYPCTPVHFAFTYFNYRHPKENAVMFRKILFGLLAVAIFGGIAVAGYEFGAYLADRGDSVDGEESVQTPESH